MAVELALRPRIEHQDRFGESSMQLRSQISGRDSISRPLSTKLETQTQQDLREIGVLQARFDRALGRRYDMEDTLIRSYNPVIDRWRIESLRLKEDQGGEKEYVAEMRKNLKTNLMERLQVGDNEVRYRVEGRNLYSEDFPNEPFTKVLQKGIDYRLKHGTPEAEREEGERIGFEKITRIMTDPETAVGTKITSFSPKGRVEKSSYDRQIIDEYELVEDLSGKHVRLTRRMVDYEEADYLSAALGLDPNHFDNYDGRPLDAWMLANPVEGAIADLASKQKGISSAKFKSIYESETLQRVIDHYVDRVLDKDVDLKKLAMAFNALLNQADKDEKRELGGNPKSQDLYLSKKTIEQRIDFLGRINPEKRGGGGCPPSKGFDVNGNGSSFLLGGSVAAFAGGSGESDEKGALTFKCNKGHFNTRPKGQLISNCTTCFESVAC